MTTVEDIQEQLRAYAPWQRLSRYALIASSSTPSPKIQKEAAQSLLAADLLNGCCTTFYKLRRSDSCFAAANHAELSSWEQQMDQVLFAEATSLESKLLSAKSSTVRESIRQAHNEMGDFLHRWGKLEDAMKHYLKARDFCTNPEQQVDSCFRMVAVCFDLRQYTNARSFVSKVLDLSSDPVVRSKALAVEGLLLMIGGNYTAAAERFLSIPSNFERESLGFLLPSDIGFYGGLCMLVTSSRAEISKFFSSHRAFNKHFLVLQPALRNLLNEFSQGNFSNSFKAVSEMKESLCIDLFLKDSADQLERIINEQLMLQYLTPYAVISLDQVASSFSIDIDTVEKTVAALIIKKALLAKIDLDKGIIVKTNKDSTAQLLEETLELTSRHAAMVQRNLVHSNLSRNLKLESSRQNKRITVQSSPSEIPPTDSATIAFEDEMEISGM